MPAAYGIWGESGCFAILTQAALSHRFPKLSEGVPEWKEGSQCLQKLLDSCLHV